MKKMWYVVAVACLGAGLLATQFGQSKEKEPVSGKKAGGKKATAAPADKSKGEIGTEELEIVASDPAFDVHVSLLEAGLALSTADAAGLADAALQMAEGERILMRPHKTVPASKLFAAAARLAGEKRDKATLDRLAKAAGKLGDKALAASIATSRKVAGDARSPEAVVTIGIDEVTPEEFAECHEVISDIHLAKLTGDSRCLRQMPYRIKKLPSKVRSKMNKLYQTCRSEMKEGGEEQPDAVLLKLAEESRGRWRAKVGKAIRTENKRFWKAF